jgi:hypothetical protein
MTMLDEHTTDCPYCGEPITLLVDNSEGDQRYIEDCAVCCRPIEVALSVQPDGEISILLARDDEA